MAVKIFYGYAYEDKAYRETLERHLSALRQSGLITDWSDRNISAGKEWVKEIDSNLNTAHLILLLISPNFMHSDYCHSIEMKRALERHENGTARVIPIILRHGDYEGAAFNHLQALPTGKIPVTHRKWSNRDEAFSDVAQGIRKVVKELLCEQWLYEGNIHFYRHQYNEALAAFEKAICFDPTNVLAYIGKGQALNQLALGHDNNTFGWFEAHTRALDAFEVSMNKLSVLTRRMRPLTLGKVEYFYI
jgi:tetratricopeptide (TPR) repeat protein